MFWFVVVLMSIIGCSSIIFSFYDSKKPILQSFSFKENTVKLFEVKSGENLSCLNGLRVLSMVVIIWGHSYSNSLGTPIFNGLYITNIMNSLLFPIIAAAPFAVDSFFFLSGFLTFYILTLKIHKMKIWHVYLH